MSNHGKDAAQSALLPLILVACGMGVGAVLTHGFNDASAQCPVTEEVAAAVKSNVGQMIKVQNGQCTLIQKPHLK